MNVVIAANTNTAVGSYGFVSTCAFVRELALFFYETWRNDTAF